MVSGLVRQAGDQLWQAPPVGLALPQGDVPDLPRHIEELHARGIRFLGYINPYLVKDGELYAEGKKRGVFAKKADGSDYLVDFGEFYCGVVDFTNPEATAGSRTRSSKVYAGHWHRRLDGGLWRVSPYRRSGAFQRGQPHDRAQPLAGALAKCNYDAVTESGKLGR